MEAGRRTAAGLFQRRRNPAQRIRPGDDPHQGPVKETRHMPKSEHSTLRGKTALVTGAGRGLGRAFAETLANLGCQVALHGMREHGPAEYGEGSTLTATAQEVATQFATKTIPVLGDLTQSSAVARVVDTVTT